MKTVVEFGVRGGRLVENQVMPNIRAGNQLADRIAFVLGAVDSTKFTVRKGSPRQSWQSSTHFVSVSLLDDAPRGPASASLWLTN